MYTSAEEARMQKTTTGHVKQSINCSQDCAAQAQKWRRAACSSKQSCYLKLQNAIAVASAVACMV